MMKKLLLPFVALVLVAFYSCSSDDTPKSTMKATIDGISYQFNTFSTEKHEYEGYTDIEVTATIDQNPDKRITIIFEQGAVGPDASWYFTYFLNETAFEKVPGFVTNVTEATGNRIKGTFSGVVLADDGSGDSISIEGGTFDIYH